MWMMLNLLKQELLDCLLIIATKPRLLAEDDLAHLKRAYCQQRQWLHRVFATSNFQQPNVPIREVMTND